MNKYYLLLSLAAVIGFSSCNTLRIEKRHYNGGWYVDFGNNKKAEADTKHGQQSDAVSQAGVVENETAVVPQTAVAVPAQGTTANGTQMATTASGDTYVWTTDQPEVTPAEHKTERGEQKMDQQKSEKKHRRIAKLPEQQGDDLALLVILAILIPPLAVYMVQGLTPLFWITLLCWLFGGFFLFGRFGYYYLGGLGLVAIVLALLVVFGKL